MANKAYSYVRFSTPEQRKGDSIRRQLARSEAYAKEHGLVIDRELNMDDFGVSAFRGSNVEKGALGAFIKAVDKGKVPKGSYLLVESMDRLSRQQVLDAFDLFRSILNKGIIILTLDDGKKYEKENLDFQNLIITLAVMSRAHQESARKSELIGSAWENKIQLAHEQKIPLTKWVPAWLELTDEGRIIEVPERVKVVRKIFQWTLDGLGTSLIVGKLDQEGIEPWGAPQNINFKKVDRSRQAKKWYPSYVQRLLKNRAVLGEYTPRSRTKNDEPIKNFFPAIIDEKTFYKVRQIRRSRDVNAGGRGAGRKGENISNLFSSLLRCGYSLEDNDGGYKCAGRNQSMVISNKGGRSLTKYIQCSRLRDGNAGCDACRKYWRYDHFEQAFLEHVLEIDTATITGSMDDLSQEIQDIKDRKFALVEKVKHNENEIKKIMAALDRRPDIPDAIIDRVKALENENKEVAKQEKELDSALNEKLYQYNHSEKRKANLFELIETMGSLSGKDLFQLRLRLAEAIKDVVGHIDIYTKGKIITPEYWQKKRKESHPEVLKALKYLEQEGNLGEGQPFFVVNYKSGEWRNIRPHVATSYEFRDVKVDKKTGRTKMVAGEKHETHSVLAGFRQLPDAVSKKKTKSAKSRPRKRKLGSGKG